jgi:hypothetical protein
MVLQKRNENGGFFLYALVDGDIHEFTIRALNPTTLTTYGDSYINITNYRPSDRPWYAAGINGTMRWTDTFMSISSPYVLTIAITVPVSNSYYLPDIVNPGMLSVGFSLDGLTEYLGNIDNVHPTTVVCLLI